MSERFDIGFLGGGQLARMSIQAAQRMGLRCVSLDTGTETPASGVAWSLVGDLDDPEAIAKILRSCDRVTLENEFIPAEALQKAFELASVPETILTPRVETLAVIQDKLLQRLALMDAGVPSPKAVALIGNAEDAIAEIGFPMVLKARFGGYDGKGTRYAKTPAELESFRDLWEGGGWLAESFVDFQAELAVMVYHDGDQYDCFPTMETMQTNHVCDLVFRSDMDGSEVAIAAVEAVGGRGLFGVELFHAKDGSILVNEIAPRPHNTGHYTLDWGGVSQFEQHIRVVMGYRTVQPKGKPTCMANLLGQPLVGDFRSGVAAALAEPDIFVHWYGKAASRPGRKMGHLNAVGEECVSRAIEARARFYRAWEE